MGALTLTRRPARGLVDVQADGADQGLAAGLGQPGVGQQRGAGLDLEQLLAGPLQRAEVAGGLHPAGQLGPGLGGVEHAAGLGLLLRGGHRLDPGGLDLGDLVEQLTGQAQAGGLGLAAGLGLALLEGGDGRRAALAGDDVGTAALWGPKVLRAGMGAHFGLHLVEGMGPAELDALGVPLVVTSSHEGALIQHQRLPWPCAWALGHEGQGVSATLQTRAALAVRIGQPGGEESLNVAAAAAICLHASTLSRADNVIQSS